MTCQIRIHLLQNEISALKKLKNQNILQLCDILQTKNNVYIFTEFCNGGDLRNILSNSRVIAEEQAVIFLK